MRTGIRIVASRNVFECACYTETKRKTKRANCAVSSIVSSGNKSIYSVICEANRSDLISTLYFGNIFKNVESKTKFECVWRDDEAKIDIIAIKCFWASVARALVRLCKNICEWTNCSKMSRLYESIDKHCHSTIVESPVCTDNACVSLLKNMSAMKTVAAACDVEAEKDKKAVRPDPKVSQLLFNVRWKVG